MTPKPTLPILKNSRHTKSVKNLREWDEVSPVERRKDMQKVRFSLIDVSSKVELRDIIKSTYKRDEKGDSKTENKDQKLLHINPHIREIEEEQTLNLPVVHFRKEKRNSRYSPMPAGMNKSQMPSLEQYKDTLR